MPIQPNDMLTIGLPAAYWDWLLAAARSAPAPHEQSDPVIQALNGQMRGHLERAQAADRAAERASIEKDPDFIGHPEDMKAYLAAEGFNASVARTAADAPAKPAKPPSKTTAPRKRK